jgi:hypothetical protein
LSDGSGDDTFGFGSISDSGLDPISSDVIVDFSTSDAFDLRSTNANTTASGNQAFSFIGSASFTGAGRLRYELNGFGKTVVQANVNGDRTMDFQVVLQGYTRPFSGGDFVL